MRYGHLIPTIYPTGVFIQSIEQTQTSTEAGGKNIVTITLTNHTQQRFEILNGSKGDVGDAAGIKKITASIDNGIGTPSVTVTATGAGVEKIVHFDFKNLKGEAGNTALAEETKQHISQVHRYRRCECITDREALCRPANTGRSAGESARG